MKNFNLAKLVVIVVVVFILAATTFVVIKKTTPPDVKSYTIPGVPYFTAFNHQDRSALVASETAASIASVLEYWNPQKYNFLEFNRILYPINGEPKLITGQSIRDVTNFVDANAFTVKEVNLNIDDLKKYINPETRTPLILFLPLDENQPTELSFHPSNTLIGVDYNTKQLTFHSYWLGNNYVLTFDQFNRLWQGMRPDERNKYYVVQPTNLSDKVKEINTRKVDPYPNRIATMDNAKTMFVNYALSKGAGVLNLRDLDYSYTLKVVNDPQFENYFPPYFKVMAYTRLASSLLVKKQNNDALNYINKAVELNHDLDKPFNDFPGYLDYGNSGNQATIHDKDAAPYQVQGDIYRALGDFKNAQNSYQKFLEMQPNNPIVTISLQIVQLELLKQGNKTK